MSERGIDLKDSRLSIGMEAGDDFAKALEGKNTEPLSPGLSSFVNIVNSAFSGIPQERRPKILATKLNALSNLQTVTSSLERQVGAPPGFGLGGIRERLAGDEDRTVIAFPGAQEVPEKVLKQIKSKLKLDKFKVFYQEKE